MPALIDLTGQRFGRLVVVHRTDPPSHRAQNRPWWLCHCDCGTEKAIFGQALRSGNTQSCGCLRHEILKRRSGEQHPMYRHGHACEGKRSKEWRTWHAMIRRCRYESMDDYERYGGRGIQVCERWQRFENFLEDVGPAPSEAHSLDRLDNDGDYESGNVRWATNSQQIRNSSKARYITLNDKTQTIGDWSKETGINRQTIQMRLDHYGWSVHDALSIPVGQKPQKQTVWMWDAILTDGEMDALANGADPETIRPDALWHPPIPNLPIASDKTPD